MSTTQIEPTTWLHGYDAVDWQAIPVDASVVGGYIDGAQSTWPAEAWQRFAAVPYLFTITTDPTLNQGDCYDCEPGNGVPEDAGPWAQRRNWAGLVHPCVYCSLSDLPRVQASVASAGATGVVYWVADWTGAPEPIPGTVGVQYSSPTWRADHGQLGTPNTDWSIFTDVSWITKGSHVALTQADLDLIFNDSRWAGTAGLVFQLAEAVLTEDSTDPNGQKIASHYVWDYTYTLVQKVLAVLTSVFPGHLDTVTAGEVASAVVTALGERLAPPPPAPPAGQ